jgi:dTDP-4-dehydrorhamnose reductase
MAKKIILLGSTGLLGSVFNAHYLDSKTDILFAPKRFELDLNDENLVYEYIKEISPDVVINCTGYNFVDQAEESSEQDLCYKLNVEIPSNLAKFSSDLDFKLVQFSSDYVFNGESKDGYDEFADTDPINYYGYTKLLAEREIAQNSSNFVIQRIAWLFGPNKTNFARYIAGELLENRPVRVVNDQFGTPTYSCDVVLATNSIIEQNLLGIFHTTNTGAVSWYELACVIAAFLGKSLDMVEPISSSELNRLAKRPHYSILYTTRLDPMSDGKSALKKYLNDYCL